MEWTNKPQKHYTFGVVFLQIYNLLFIDMLHEAIKGECCNMNWIQIWLCQTMIDDKAAERDSSEHSAHRLLGGGYDR